jgi:magnesium-transporting ATPase (P-type)
MRLVIAWVGGIAVFMLLHTLLNWLGHQIGVPVLLDLGYTHYYSDRYEDYETDSTFTNFGVCISIITFMLAIRAGMLINSFPYLDEVSPEDNVQFFCWLLGLSILAVLMALIDLAFRETYSKLADFVNVILQFSAVGGVWWSMKALHDKKLEKLRKRNNDVDPI